MGGGGDGATTSFGGAGHMPPMRVGDRVLIRGLTTATDLNNKEATITHTRADKRFTVQLVGLDKTVAVEKENLVLIPGPGAAAPPPKKKVISSLGNVYFK